MKNNIIKKNSKMKWYIKLAFVILFCMLAVTAVFLLKFYYDVNKQNNQSYLEQNIIADFDSNKSNYKIFKSDDGMLGVMNKDDRTIIDPQWNNIYFLNSNRFVVQKKINDVPEMGIIDVDENYTVPFIYKEFISVGKEYLLGYFEDETGFSIFDTSGNLISDQKWLKYSYDDENKLLTVSRENADYTYSVNNKEIILSDIVLKHESDSDDSFEITTNIPDADLLNVTEIEKVRTAFNISCDYFESLICNDRTKIEKITNSHYYQSLSSNDFFKDCTINRITGVSVKKSYGENEGYNISAEIDYEYTGKDKVISNLKSKISLSVIYDGDSMILKSINKEEL